MLNHGISCSCRFTGVCGITLNSDFSAPQDPNNPLDVEAAERVMQCKFGWFANPVYGDGDYPKVMKDTLARKCKAMGRESTLPEFTDDEKKSLKGGRRLIAEATG